MNDRITEEILKDLFDFTDKEKYLDSGYLKDALGVFAKRKYPPDVRFINYDRNGSPDYYALIQVVISDDIDRPDNKIPVAVDIYKNPTKIIARAVPAIAKSLQERRDYKQPININSERDFCLDLSSKKFVFEGKLYTGNQMLDKLFSDQHLSTTKERGGIFVRTRLRLDDGERLMIVSFIECIKWILVIGFNRKPISGSPMEDAAYAGYKRLEKVDVNEENTWDLLGYKASRGAAFIMAIFFVLLACYISKYLYDPIHREITSPFLSVIFSNAFFEAAFVLLIFVIVEKVLPIVFFYAAQVSSNLLWRIWKRTYDIRTFKWEIFRGLHYLSKNRKVNKMSRE